MEQASLALRERICHLGVPPDIAADVLGAFDASRRAQARWGVAAARRSKPMPSPAAPRAPQEHAVALSDVPQVVAPFCHDVLLYRAFIGPAYQAAARDWLGPSMWHLVESLGGWRRVHTLPLPRLVDEAMTASAQAPSFLRPPMHWLQPLNLRDLWELTRPWVRKYVQLDGLNVAQMATHSMTAGAWLWVMDRTDADVRRRGDTDLGLPERTLRLAERVDEAVGLRRLRQ